MAISLGNSEAVSQSQIASTLAHTRPVLSNAISNATPLLSFLMGQMGRVLRESAGLDGERLPGTIVGGRDIDVPVRLVKNTAVGSYRGRDTLDISEQDTDRIARFPIAQNYGTVSISGRELRGNKGESAVYNLLTGKINAMEQDLKEDLTRQAVGDGTGNGGKDLLGLGAAIGTSTYATINPTTYTSWQPGHDSAGNGIDATTDFSAAGYAEMMTRFTAVSDGNDHPDAVFMAENVFGMFEANLTGGTAGSGWGGTVQYTTFEFGEAGFAGLKFKGQGVFFDRQIADGNIYYLNSAHLMFVRDSGGDFVWLTGDSLDRPIDQDAFVRIMVVEGNMICNDRRKIGNSNTVTA